MVPVWESAIYWYLQDWWETVYHPKGGEGRWVGGGGGGEDFLKKRGRKRSHHMLKVSDLVVSSVWRWLFGGWLLLTRWSQIQ